jgi:hypothetical protein
MWPRPHTNTIVDMDHLKVAEFETKDLRRCASATVPPAAPPAAQAAAPVLGVLRDED